MNKYFEDLDLDLVLKIANRHLKTEIAIAKAENPRFYSEYNQFNFEHKCLEEGIAAMYGHGEFPIDKSYDLKKLVDYGFKGGVYDVDSFQKIYLDIRTSINVGEYIKHSLKNSEYLIKKIEKFKELSIVKEYYVKVFDDSFLVKDTASPLLNEIRKRIKRNEKNIKSLIVDQVKKYKDLLNDTTYYVKGGNYVLPVKTAFKNRVSGLIYDVSDSGETTFIQPADCQALSNEIIKDQNLEKEEIYNIFRALTREILVYRENILDNNQIFAELDFLNAKFRFIKEIDGNIIETKDDTHFNIHNARHPLIDKSKVVGNDILMDTRINQLIISGPNAGGKSVFLKLIGVLVCLNQMIYPLPVNENSTIGFFKKVYTDIGDLQSIQHNLSTFSAHISNISEFLVKVKNRDLVLIDELGTGTDPNDGEALAVAICSYLNKTRCKSVITSHFNGMKQYSFTNSHIMCGSMIFDEKKMTPHYKLQIGIPGKSYGILIAKKYGIEEHIVDHAVRYLKDMKDASNDEYIVKLNKEISDVQKLKDELEIKSKDLENKLNEAKKNNENLQRKLESFSKDTNELRNEIIQETKEKIEEIKRQLAKNPNLKLHDLIAFEGDLDEFEIKEEIEEEVTETFGVGDYIRDDFLMLEGKVIAVKKDKLDIITEGGKRYSVTISANLRKVAKPKVVKQQVSGDAFINALPLKFELNLIGLHVDEAISELDRYLDKAILANKERIKVIHGFGTGALRNAVHAYLKKSKYVKSYKLGGEFDGGLGSTIVILK